MPQAMYSFGETVLPVCPTWLAYGYQPASTTARVAATAPPSSFASASTREKFSGFRRLLGPVLDLYVDLRHLGGAADLLGLEGPGADQGEARLALPADVEEDGVLERGPLAHELPILLDDIDEVPVEARVEAGGKAGGHVGGENGRAEEDFVEANRLDQAREHVDARLR